MPGSISVRPSPIEIEQREPGGVSWTKRRPSFTVWSCSNLNPARSA